MKVSYDDMGNIVEDNSMYGKIAELNKALFKIRKPII
jgi:hypothetical protein